MYCLYLIKRLGVYFLYCGGVFWTRGWQTEKWLAIQLASTLYNESTAGADASVEALKLHYVYDMKLLTLAYLALLGTR